MVRLSFVLLFWCIKSFNYSHLIWFTPPPRNSDFNRILDKYTRFFDFRYDVKNSLDGSSISLEDLLDISTTASSVDIGV